MFRTILLLLAVYVTRISSFLHFPPSTVCGVLLAIAVPLDLPNYNVFLSYNFEANYNVPIKASDITAGPALLRTRRADFEGNELNKTLTDMDLSEKYLGNGTVETRPPFEAFITRRRIYQWIEDKLKVNGLKGHECLLRAICEHVDSSFSKHNGFLGDIAHILLSPHTSKKEPNMEDYYIAEIRGESYDCSIYAQLCPINILDFISKVAFHS
ncbi:uncharacterized protein LOC134828396 [Culicoides brevitarsis]|uniref:uncharacterized protein LOC134828396 n=1 Tax=Culicoides brevitarsis TaxID=469753 RepID=UPI00307C0B3C